MRVAWRWSADAVGPRRRAERGQALVETALVLPVLLLLAFGVVGVARGGHTQMAVGAVAREAARAGALATSPADAADTASVRAHDVARGYGLELERLRLDVDPGAFRRGDRVRAVARYEVVLSDLPLLSWTRVDLSVQHAEPIDPYRSRGGGGGR